MYIYSDTRTHRFYVFGIHNKVNMQITERIHILKIQYNICRRSSYNQYS